MAKRIKTVTFLREVNDDEKMAPQAKAIVASAVEAHGLNEALTVDQVTTAMEGNIETKQPLTRVFGYYAPKLEEAELISVERTEGETAPKSGKSKEAEDVGGELEDENEEA